MIVTNLTFHTLTDTQVLLSSEEEYVVPTPSVSLVTLSTETIMTSSENLHQEAYYLYFIAVLGMVLNLVVTICIILRRTQRKMTSAFLIHGCFLNFVKAMFCIPFGNNLFLDNEPSSCKMQASSYIVIVTASAFNLVAMICTEAYTFGENNIGGTSRGTLCCCIFGILTVYIASTTLHLGPTLIGGSFKFYAEIGNCSFVLGEPFGYVAHLMWILTITLALMCATHFLCKFYKEIQLNKPNRVSMLVRTSITIMDEPRMTASTIRELVAEATHRAKIFVMTAIMFVVCWYPLFLLILGDISYKVSPKVYQTFSFIAWSQATLEPLLYIMFDRKLNLLSRFIYCDHYRRYNREQIAYLMSRHRQPSRPNSSNMDSVIDHYPGDPHLSMDHHMTLEHQRGHHHHHHDHGDLRNDPNMERSSTIDSRSRIGCRHCRYEQEELEHRSMTPSSTLARDEKGLGPDTGVPLEVQC